MNRQEIDVLELMHDNRLTDWNGIRARAAAAGVGDSRWEDAWMAARQAQAAGMAAFWQAIGRGADRLSAAAVAGMVAALKARPALTEEQFRVLVEPVGSDPHPAGGRNVEDAA